MGLKLGVFPSCVFWKTDFRFRLSALDLYRVSTEFTSKESFSGLSTEYYLTSRHWMADLLFGQFGFISLPCNKISNRFSILVKCKEDEQEVSQTVIVPSTKLVSILRSFCELWSIAPFDPPFCCFKWKIFSLLRSNLWAQLATKFFVSIRRSRSEVITNFTLLFLNDVLWLVIAA